MAKNQFCDTTDPIYFYILYNTVISVWTDYSSSVTLTWNTSSCMGLELLHVNGEKKKKNPFTKFVHYFNLISFVLVF